MNCLHHTVITLSLMAASAIQADDKLVESWPQFRGPQGQGMVAEKRLPVHWSETEGIVWKCVVPGLGHSSPVHDSRTIWMTTADFDGHRLRAVSIDAATGELKQDLAVFTPAELDALHASNSFASPSPVLAAGRLYVHYGTYGTACIDTSCGQVLWKNNEFSVDHQGGPGSSPVLYDDLLILSLDGVEKPSVAALDTATGKVRWQRERSCPLPDNPAAHRAFSTPLIVDVDGTPQLISPGAHQCHAYDARTGEELWHVCYAGFSNVPRPIANQRQCFICTGFLKPELWAVRLGGQGDVTESHVDWKFKGPVPEIPSPVLIDKTIYLISSTGILTAIDTESGKKVWMRRIGGNFSASPLSANGLLYLSSEEGVVTVVDPYLESREVVASNQLPGRIKASPAVLGTDLLIRTDEALYRIRNQEAD